MIETESPKQYGCTEFIFGRAVAASGEDRSTPLVKVCERHTGPDIESYLEQKKNRAISRGESCKKQTSAVLTKQAFAWKLIDSV